MGGRGTLLLDPQTKLNQKSFGLNKYKYKEERGRGGGGGTGGEEERRRNVSTVFPTILSFHNTQCN